MATHRGWNVGRRGFFVQRPRGPWGLDPVTPPFICIYICACTYTCTCACTGTSHAHTHKHYTRMCVCVCVCAYIYISFWVYIYVYVYVYVSTYACMRMYTVMYICIYARRFVGRCGVHANKYGGVCVCVHENLYRRVCVCLSIVCLQYCMHKRTCMYAVLYTRMHKMLCVRLCLCRHVCLCSVRIHTNTCICVWMCVFFVFMYTVLCTCMCV
jgi:hypothetical protein